MNSNELRDKEYEYCKDEENAFYADPSDANIIAALCKRDEFSKTILRQLWDAIHPDEHAQEEGSYTIPLYTHPVKELTDEEIMEVYREVSEPFGEKRLYEIHEFARAILRKASEK